MKLRLLYFLLYFCSVFKTENLIAQQVDTTLQSAPELIFKNGQAQVVPASFDSENDGKLDRMHVYVTRPAQTQTTNLKLPVVYMPSPYYGLKLWPLMGFSTKKNYWNVKHELGETPKAH